MTTAPATTAPATAAAYWARAARCLALDELTARSSTILDGAGIPHLLLKGPATAHRLYPERPDQRFYTDVDLLVPPDRFDDAERALAEGGGYTSVRTGLRPWEYLWYEVTWFFPESGPLHLDLHRGFAGVENAAAFFTALWADRTLLAVGGKVVAAPSAAGTALIVALHAACPGPSRKPLKDLNRAVEIFDAGTWRDAARMARVCDAESACRTGLELLPPGADLADRSGFRGNVNAHQWLRGRHYGPVSTELAAVVVQRGTAASVRLMLRKMLPSPVYVRRSDAGAGRSSVPLPLAYARRLWRAGRLAPRAVLDVRMATRQVKRGRSSGRLPGPRPVGEWLLVADGRSVSTVRWAAQQHRSVRAQLTVVGVQSINMSAPPSGRSADRRAVAAVLRLLGATCLEGAIVLQRFDAAAGRPREIIIAVTAPRAIFRAHAWLDGDRPPGPLFHELIRHGPQPHWLTEVD